MSVTIKSTAELDGMRAAGRLNARVRQALREAIRPGVTGRELDELAKRMIAEGGGEPTFVGYAPGGRPPYPGAICFSVNEELVHGIPSDRALRDGDIVSIDLGVTLGGWVSDAAFTAAVGDVPDEVRELLEATERSLWTGIEQARPGNYIGDISHAIGEVGKAHGYGIPEEYGGHGVGREMHEPPHVPNFGRRGVGYKLKAGMVLALEPMFALGAKHTRELEDQWTVCMVDGTLSAHFEETVAITADGPEELTRIDAG